MKKLLLLLFIFGLVCGLLGAGLVLLVARQPRGQPVALAPLPTPPPVVIQLDGAVAQPGVYTLPAGSRVQDAIRAAGGFLAAADPGALNQAAILKDGERISVDAQSAAPAGKTAPTVTPTPFSDNTLRRSGSPTRGAKKINLNTATQAELESLPGIGPAFARRIIEYRQAHGPFKTIEQVLEVDGIGQKTFEQIKELITVG